MALSQDSCLSQPLLAAHRALEALTAHTAATTSSQSQRESFRGPAAAVDILRWQHLPLAMAEVYVPTHGNILFEKPTAVSFFFPIRFDVRFLLIPILPLCTIFYVYGARLESVLVSLYIVSARCLLTLIAEFAHTPSDIV
jgi:hypothetical protein